MNLLIEAVEFLKSNPYPTDDTLHAYCERNNIDEHEFEKTVYILATAFVRMFLGGKSEGGSKPVEYESELKRGIEVEYEHTPDAVVAEKIARDHLAEFPNYYTELDKMEKLLELGKTIQMPAGA